MNRYRFELEVYDAVLQETVSNTVLKDYHVAVTAPSEHEARRMVFDQASYNHVCIKKITVTAVEVKGE